MYVWDALEDAKIVVEVIALITVKIHVVLYVVMHALMVLATLTAQPPVIRCVKDVGPTALLYVQDLVKVHAVQVIAVTVAILHVMQTMH
jgi:hypothetical protein